MKRIALLGSTGSIGTQALDVIRAQGFGVTALAANRSIGLLERQAREWNPAIVCIYQEDLYKELKARLADLPIKVVAGMEGLCEAAAAPGADITLNAVGRDDRPRTEPWRRSEPKRTLLSPIRNTGDRRRTGVAGRGGKRGKTFTGGQRTFCDLSVIGRKFSEAG